MSKYTKVGTITAAGTAGNQVVTGLGFRPSAVILIWNPTVTVENTNKDDYYIGWGVFASNGGQWSHWVWTDNGSLDGGASSGFSSTGCLSSTGSPGNPTCRQVTSFAKLRFPQ